MLVRLALAHKEVRFLLPVAPLAPALLVPAASRGEQWLGALARRPGVRLLLARSWP